MGEDFEKKEDELFGEDGFERWTRLLESKNDWAFTISRSVYAEDVTSMRELFITDAPAATVLVRLMTGSVFLSEGIQKFLYPEDLAADASPKSAFPLRKSWARLLADAK